MDSTKFTVLDIGHGNCSLIESSDSFTIIDAAQGSDVQNILNEKSITQIDDLIISHSDKDHVGGAIAILLDDAVTVKRVHLNPDGIKTTATWGDFRSALAYARGLHNTNIVTAINCDSPDLEYSDYCLEVLSPYAIDCVTGVGTLDEEGNKLDANSMSVVLRLKHNDENIALIPGDMDSKTLDFLMREYDALDAKILVFPHHGGRPGQGDPEEFAKLLCEKVNPELILFSNSRFKHNNPIPAVISGAKQSNCGAHLACTQMSTSCCNDKASLSNEHLMSIYPSKGHTEKHSCAGSITIVLNGRDTDVSTPLEPHRNYITGFDRRKCV